MISKSSETFWRPGGFGRTQKAHDDFFLMLRTLSRKWTAKIFGHQQFETPSSRGNPLFLDTCTSIDVTCGLRSDFFLSHPRGRLGCFRK